MPDAQCHPAGEILVLRDDSYAGCDDAVCVQPSGREVLTGIYGGELYVSNGTVAMSLGPSKIMKLFSSKSGLGSCAGLTWVQSVMLQDGHVGWVYEGTYVLP
jgi:hypothetical protein